LAPAVESNGISVYGGFPNSQSKTDNFKAPGDDETDSGNDGLTNGAEIGLGTNPFNPDTDGDGYSDKAEVDFGTNPLDKNSSPTCADGSSYDQGLNACVVDVAPSEPPSAS
jgi:Bacterial TSP3 repeat